MDNETMRLLEEAATVIEIKDYYEDEQQRADLVSRLRAKAVK